MNFHFSYEYGRLNLISHILFSSFQKYTEVKSTHNYGEGGRKSTLTMAVHIAKSTKYTMVSNECHSWDWIEKWMSELRMSLEWVEKWVS